MAGDGSKAEAAAKGTDYTVLEKVAGADGGVVWKVAGTTTTTTREAAAKAVAGEREGTFKPVPTRSWAGAFNAKVETVKKATTNLVSD